MITTEFVRGSFQWSSTYWLDGKSYPVPPGLSPTVDDQGTFNGSVRTPGGSFIGSFRSTAGGQSGHGCLGDTSLVTSVLGSYVNLKDKDAVERFLDSLEVTPDTNPVFRDSNVESAIRGKLEQEKREAKQKEEDDKRKADEARKAKEEAERKAKEAEEQKAKEDAERGSNAADGAKQDPANPDANAGDNAKPADTNTAGGTTPEHHDEPAPSPPPPPPEREHSGEELAAYAHEMEGDKYMAMGTTFWPGAYREYKEAQRLYWTQSVADKLAQIGPSVEGAVLVAAGLDAGGKAMARMNSNVPNTFDVQATGRVFFTGGSGYGFSLIPAGVLGFHFAFESFDSQKWNRAYVLSMGLTIQLPLKRSLSMRVLEVGGSVGSMRLPLADADIATGFHMRSGIVYRPIGGLAFALSLGFDTTAASSTQFAEAFFADLGVLWRFDTNDNRKYMIQ